MQPLVNETSHLGTLASGSHPSHTHSFSTFREAPSAAYLNCSLFSCGARRALIVYNSKLLPGDIRQGLGPCALPEGGSKGMMWGHTSAPKLTGTQGKVVVQSTGPETPGRFKCCQCGLGQIPSLLYTRINSSVNVNIKITAL